MVKGDVGALDEGGIRAWPSSLLSKSNYEALKRMYRGLWAVFFFVMIPISCRVSIKIGIMSPIIFMYLALDSNPKLWTDHLMKGLTKITTTHGS